MADPAIVTDVTRDDATHATFYFSQDVLDVPGDMPAFTVNGADWIDWANGSPLASNAIQFEFLSVNYGDIWVAPDDEGNIEFSGFAGLAGNNGTIAGSSYVYVNTERITRGLQRGVF